MCELTADEPESDKYVSPSSYDICLCSTSKAVRFREPEGWVDRVG